MRKRCSKWFIPAGAVMLAVYCAPVTVVAADTGKGESSGPAAGTTTTPGTAAQKQNSARTDSSVAGAPGVSGKQGAESGAKPKDSGANDQSTPR